MALSAWQTRAAAAAAPVVGAGLAWWAIGRASPAGADAAPGLAGAVLAHQFCSRQSAAEDEGGCQLISVARWAQLEPDNALPWLFAAAEARTRKDVAGMAEALHRASQARLNDVRFARSAQVAQAQVPDDVAPALALGIDIKLIGVEVASVLRSGRCPT